jgi:hypothetical protein
VRDPEKILLESSTPPQATRGPSVAVDLFVKGFRHG